MDQFIAMKNGVEAAFATHAHELDNSAVPNALTEAVRLICEAAVRPHSTNLEGALCVSGVPGAMTVRGPEEQVYFWVPNYDQVPFVNALRIAVGLAGGTLLLDGLAAAVFI